MSEASLKTSEPESTRVPSPVRRSLWPSLSAPAGAIVCALTASACAALGSVPPAAPEPEPASAPDEWDHENPPPAPGIKWTSEEDFAVRVVSGSITCTGSLVAADRVLTAHHCVAARAQNGDILPQDVEPSSIRIELGGDGLPWGELVVRAIVAPTCGYSGGEGDLAILVLKRPLRGVPPRQVELDGAPTKGQAVVPIGFGRCADASDGTYRKRRPVSQVNRVFEGRVELQAAICPGDSGGPALDEGTGKIVGVVSRSVMDNHEATPGLTELARVDAFRAVFATAAQVASGTSLAELPPIGCHN